MPRAVSWGFLLGILATGVPQTSRAEDPAAEREAQARFEEGIARVKAGNFEGARMSFTQAYAVVKKPTILWNLALAEEKTHHTLDALAHFKEYAHTVPSDDRSGAEKHITDLMAQTGHLDISAPSGAQVTVDGAVVGQAPMHDPVDVLPGHHHVEAHTPQPVKEVDLEVGAAQVLHVNLAQSAELSRPPASLPSTPPPSSPAPSEAEPTPAPPEATSPAPPAEQPAAHAASSAPRLIAVTLIGTATAVSVALGAYYAIQSQNDQNTASAFRAQYPNYYCSTITFGTTATCTAWNNSVQAQSRDAMLSNIFYVVGGVLAVGGVATWFMWPTANAGPSGASVGVAGRF